MAQAGSIRKLGEDLPGLEVEVGDAIHDRCGSATVPCIICRRCPRVGPAPADHLCGVQLRTDRNVGIPQRLAHSRRSGGAHTNYSPDPFSPEAGGRRQVRRAGRGFLGPRAVWRASRACLLR